MSEWISVKDRLPPQNGDAFLAYCPSSIEDDFKIHCLKYRKDSNESTPYVEISGEGYWRPGYVSHWMPLPEPPKSDDEVYIKGNETLVFNTGTGKTYRMNDDMSWDVVDEPPIPKLTEFTIPIDEILDKVYEKDGLYDQFLKHINKAVIDIPLSEPPK